jgi:hypothetical protein
MATLSRALMAAEAQLDAMAATGLPLGAADIALLRDFLRDCRIEAAELEAELPPPLILSNAGEAGR